MNLEDLRAAQVDERGTDSLQPLPASFYEQAADYLADLRRRRDRIAERADDPFDSPEVRRLTDELETAEEVVEAIYERRLSKLVKRASLAASGVPTDEEGLTDEERTLFGDLVDRIEANRARVLDVLDNGSGDVVSPADDAPADPEPVGEPPAPEPAGDPAASTDRDPEPDGGAAAPGGPEEDRLTVRITAEVGEIYGVDDRVYTLGEEDVVTLPSANAKPLLERGAAQRVE